MGLLMGFVQTINDGLSNTVNNDSTDVKDPIWDDFKEVYRETTGKEVSEGTNEEGWDGND